MAAILDKHVQCNNCKQRYPVLYDEIEPDEFGNYNQGINCATRIHSEGVYGNYGSCIDDVRNVIWVAEKPQHLVDGKVLCDNCVNRFLAQRVLLNHNQNEMSCTDLGRCGCAECLAEIAHRVPVTEYEHYRWSPDILRCPCTKCQKLRAIWRADKHPGDHFLNAWRRTATQMRTCGCHACVEILVTWHA